MPSHPVTNKTFVIGVKSYAKACIKAFWFSPILRDFIYFAPNIFSRTVVLIKIKKSLLNRKQEILKKAVKKNFERGILRNNNTCPSVYRIISILESPVWRNISIFLKWNLPQLFCLWFLGTITPDHQRVHLWLFVFLFVILFKLGSIYYIVGIIYLQMNYLN